MSENEKLSGYAIERVYTTHQELRQKARTEIAAEGGAMTFGWDWRWLKRPVFEVRILVGIEATVERPEAITTNVVGRFSQVGDGPSIAIEKFVRLQAVAILLPYARQFLSSLSANSQHGAYYLPTLNVNVLMKDVDTSKSTAAKQEAAERSRRGSENQVGAGETAAARGARRSLRQRKRGRGR